ncbi:MAG: DUF4275 family protein [Oscillospiraceae bacterium]|nr:DUF4275 family protein [Oscillospiraceae bacterium]
MTEDIGQRWLEAFTEGVSEELLNKYVIEYGNYLWHIFSWELVPCVSGDAARSAFDLLEYDRAIRFEGGGRSGKRLLMLTNISETGKLSALDLESVNDVYITAEDFSWTYVHTHESCCGPYFLKK